MPKPRAGSVPATTVPLMVVVVPMQLPNMLQKRPQGVTPASPPPLPPSGTALHTLGMPPPPHTAPIAQVPQLVRRPPQLSPMGPQLALIEAQVRAVQPGTAPHWNCTPPAPHDWPLG